MTNSPHIEPAIQPIAVDEVLLDVREERQVIIHCNVNLRPGDMVRIWKSTYLLSKPDGGRIPLLHAENISFAPLWTMVYDFCVYRFTLVFDGLPTGCTSFDMIEEIEESGSFYAQGIMRNETDVYQIWL